MVSMKTEHSAGGVIVSRIRNEWYILVLKDMNDTWTLPKGLIEKGESPEEAAAREIKEEVGITSLKLFSPLTPIQYTYKRNGLVKKTVQYFIFVAGIRTKPTVQKEEGIREARWMPIDKAIEIIGYRETNVGLLEETRLFLMSSRA